MRNIFHERYMQNEVKLALNTFLKSKKLSMSLDQASKILYSLLLLYVHLEDSQYIETKMPTIFISCEAF